MPRALSRSKTLLASCLLVGLPLGLAAPAAADDAPVEVKRLEQAYFAGDAVKVEVDLSFGSLRVEGSDSSNLSLELIATCTDADSERCRRKADLLQIAPRLSKDTFKIGLERTPRGRLFGLEAELILHVPRDLALEIDLRGGDVFVEGMRGAIEVDSATSAVDIVHSQDLVERVKLAVGLGKAELWLRDSRIEGSGFPRSVDWNGSGTAKIEVDLGGGEARVRLE